ncbi:hypothetical protein KBD61_06385 [Patescibacteria group bacterium]|nr:hypothetical protein [Patescibacteria group bacterium]MBP9710613.1 hypothetical protein [Patescibacteria group bacterium]
MDISIPLMLQMVFTCDHHAARATRKKATQGSWFFRNRMMNTGTSFKNLLHLIEQLFCNDRLMFSFVQFLSISKEASIERIGKNVRNSIFLEWIAKR